MNLRPTAYAALLLATLIVACAWSSTLYAQPPAGGGANGVELLARLRVVPAFGIMQDGRRAPGSVQVVREWTGDLCRCRVVNHGLAPVRLQSVVLFSLPEHRINPNTPILAEGFTMLGLTVGTLGKPEDLCDADSVFDHRSVPGMLNAWGMLALSLTPTDEVVLAFTSCNRFPGKFVVDGKRMEVVVDTDGLTLAPGATWELEEFAALRGRDRSALLDRLAARLAEHHPRLKAPLPVGWCSWYCFGPNVSRQQIEQNIAWIKASAPAIKFIQIDDGYQPAMGDWFEPGSALGGKAPEVMKEIARQGLVPAIWVAPFVASANSKLFKEHPDWFIKGDDGKPILSDKNWRGAWRQGPWYTLDGTHPGAQKYLEETFRRMREEWGCRYFKLDANSWGCAPGQHYNQDATRVEAFRQGMAAILRGAGKESFVLGCNSPMWPSLGLVHGNRSGGDILSGAWEYVAWSSRLNMLRNWQNDRLWWNDPDCLKLVSGRTENETIFHATTLRLSGGMFLPSDNMPALSDHQRAILQKMFPPTGVAARFANMNLPQAAPGSPRLWGHPAIRFVGDGLQCGVVKCPDRLEIGLLNWSEEPKEIPFRLDGPHSVVDFWSDEKLGVRLGEVRLPPLPPHSARLLVCRPTVTEAKRN